MAKQTNLTEKQFKHKVKRPKIHSKSSSKLKSSKNYIKKNVGQGK